MSRRPRGYLKNPQNLIYDFKQREKNDLPLNPFAVEQDDQTLYNAILKEFNSFDHFLVKAGYDPAKIRIQQRWSRNKIKKELDRMYNEGHKFKYQENKQKNDIYRNIVCSLIYYFDSLKDGLKEFGYKKKKTGELKRFKTKEKMS